MSHPAVILNTIKSAIEPIVSDDGGRVEVASTLEHALEILAVAPSSWRLILTFEGYGGHPAAENGMNEARYLVILHVNNGLLNDAGSRLYEDGPGERLSFLSRLEEVSGMFRALRWPDGYNVNCAGLALDTSEWIADAPGNTTAHALTFTLEGALPSLPDIIAIPAP